jgi:hypothetical protein
MEKARVRTFPRWLFMILSIGGAWASGIYLGKISVTGFTLEFLIPAIVFGVMSLIMAWGVLGSR